MPLTRSFKDTVKARVERDPEFRRELLREGVQTILSGDLDAGKSLLRDYINATVGFEEVGRATEIPPESLMRMFGPRGNPQSDKLVAVLAYLRRQGGTQLRVSPA